MQQCQREDIQRFKFDDSLCQNCSTDEDLRGNFRADIYALRPMPLPIITMCIENPVDVVYVLSNESGTFERIENQSVLHAHKINGVSKIENNIINLIGTSNKVFEILVAYLLNGIFSLKYGILVQGSKVTI